MNLNYDLMMWLDYFIGAFVCCFGSFMVGKILLRKSFKNINKVRLLLLIPLTIFTIFNTLAFDNIFKIFGSLIVVFFINRYIINEKGINTFFYSFFTYIIIIMGELFYGLILSVFDYIFYFSITEIIAKTIYTNIIIALFSVLIAYLFRNKIDKYTVLLLNKSSFLIVALQCFVSVTTVIALINYLYIDKFKFSYKFVLITVTILGSVILTLSLFKQYLNNREVIGKYNILQEYLKTSADLIEKYSTVLHKYKNNLIIIKGYLKSDIPEANNYIDGLLEKIEDKKYSWVKKINYISIDGIRYIIYYKLSKAEELNLKIYVNVSRDIKRINLKNLKSNELGHILDIIGEYFDNAIYASNESENKELNFDLYQEKDLMIFKISNTYKNNVDLNLINKNGYTTKGKGHGFGLYDIDKTIKSMRTLNSAYEIIDKYFVITFTINIECNKKSVNLND